MSRAGAPSSDASGIDSVRWQPAGTYPLALEVLSLADLRRRAPASHWARFQRVHFFILMTVVRGRTRHTVDFTPVDAVPGTWLLLRPQQVQRFDFSRPWGGWAVVFRPELVPALPRSGTSPLPALGAQLARLPGVMHLQARAHAQCEAIVRRMRADAALAASVDDRNALLAFQLGTLATRLQLVARGLERGADGTPGSNADERIERLRALAERQAGRRRPAAWYAGQIGCHARTLDRALRASCGQGTKQWLDERLALEAKRRLVHASDPIKRIAADLGFADESNFTKFFRRLAGRTPLDFRRTQGG
jgi:AraC-like DNA-binding protein